MAFSMRFLRLSGKHYGDGTLALSLFGSGTDDDFDIHPQFGQESDQTFLGVTLEVTTQEGGYLGLVDPQ